MHCYVLYNITWYSTMQSTIKTNDFHIGCAKKNERPVAEGMPTAEWSKWSRFIKFTGLTYVFFGE